MTIPDSPQAMRGRTVVDCPHAALGFDSDEVWSAEQYSEMRALGFRFAFRYLGDLKSREVDDALASGLLLSAIQHAHASGWTLSAELGAADGARAVADARAAGLPPALPLWCDLEEPALSTTVFLVYSYSQAWCAHVVGAGYEAGVYWGAGMPGDAQQVYQLAFTRYFKSFSNVVTPWRRGYQLEQLYRFPRGECQVSEVFPEASPLVGGRDIDAIVSRSDYLGSVPRMLKAA